MPSVKKCALKLLTVGKNSHQDTKVVHNKCQYGCLKIEQIWQRKNTPNSLENHGK